MMKLKLDDQGHVVVVDDKPVYTHDDGQDRPFDAIAAVSKITALNGEAKGHRTAKEAAEARLALFGELDPVKAKEALDKLDSIDKKKLVDAGEVERVKQEVTSALEAKYKPIEEQNGLLKTQLDNEIIGGAFTRSKFIADKVAVPPPFLRAQYGRNFKVEEGKLVAYDNAGNPMYSRIKAGEAPEFDEALELLIGADPYKDDILKGRGAAGSGASGGGGGGNGRGGRQISRAQFDTMGQVERAQAMVDKVQVVD